MSDNTNFTYPKSSYSKSELNPIPEIYGQMYGTFECDDPQIQINIYNGSIDLNSSSIGNYTIKYIIEDEYSTFDIEIT